jgi:FtsP/CotA-like multicopper oxidase with cupredoxin domain
MKLFYKTIPYPWVLTVTAMTACLLLAAGSALAGGINGIVDVTNFEFTAKAGELSTPDGGSYHFWGYEDLGDNEGVGLPQYPGPTLILKQNDSVTITLNSQLPFGRCTSIVFPGHQVTATGGTAGLLTQESCAATDTVTYQFTASEPGTYIYYSGTEPGLQVEMGLLGVIIVRPAGHPKWAYHSAETAFDHEVMFLLSSMDPHIHTLAEQNRFDEIDLNARWPVYWFINGRAAPDDLVGPYVTYLPHQPYNVAARMTPGQKMLVRIIGGDQDQHPLHLHGNHYHEIARYGRMLSSNGIDPDLQRGKFTTLTVPGQTVDAIFTWTGEKLGWDIYGTPADGMPAHDCKDTDPADGYADADADYPMEWCADHNKPFPVLLPENQDLAFGGWWSGSPFMGGGEPLPPGEGGLNPNGGFFFMWHSHTEKELTNFDIFPGGMLGMMVVEPPGTVID